MFNTLTAGGTYTVSEKSCHYILDYNSNKNCPITIISGRLINHIIGHRNVVSHSHLIYLVQVSYHGKLLNHENHEFSLKL